MDVRIYEQDYEKSDSYMKGFRDGQKDMKEKMAYDKVKYGTESYEKGFYAGIKRGRELAYQDISKMVEEIQNEPFARKQVD